MTTGLFFVSSVSGVALFFHWMPGMFHSMHIWLSMVLLLPFFLHLWRNWSQFLIYFRNRNFFLPFAVSILAAVAFMMTTGHKGGNPAARIFPLLTHATIDELAPLFHVSPEQLTARITHKGYQVTSTGETLEEIADAAKKQSSELLMDIMSRQEHPGGTPHQH
nr:hypothetical protein [Acetobacter musti]